MIRSYNTQDKAKLLEIFRCNIPVYFDPSEIQDFSAYLDKNGETYLTLENNGQIAGGAGYLIHTADGSGRITWIFIHPAYYGLGLGRKLMDHCMNLLIGNGVVTRLEVTTSQLAYGFFECFGFELVSTKKDHWGKGLDLYFMKREL